MKESIKNIKEHITSKVRILIFLSPLLSLSLQVDGFGKDCLINAFKTCMSSKLIGADSDFFSRMVVEAAQDIRENDGKGGYNYPIKVGLSKKQLTQPQVIILIC